MPEPAGRFSVALNPTSMLQWQPTWTHLDQLHPNLVTSYTIDRGRQFELDRTDGGRATVEVLDPDGVLDPTNLSSPYSGLLEPMLPARLGRRNPVTGEWYTRFRGWIEEFDYQYDPSQRLGRLTVSLVDIFEILQAIEMHLGPLTPPAFGDEPSNEYLGNIVWFGGPYDGGVLIQDRIERALQQAQIPTGFYVVFSGNVFLHQGVYSPGESVMTVIQEAADAEFPGVSNVYTDRRGRLVVHGREAKFDPEGVEAGTDPDTWTFLEFQAGDGAAVAASPTTTAQVRRFAFNRGLAKIINHASAFPYRLPSRELAPSELAGQTVINEASVAKYGYRSWTAQNLLTHAGRPPINTTDLEETAKFAQYYVLNYAEPRNRITEIQFRSMRPGNLGADATWNLLTRVDIADTVTVRIDGPGGGGFDTEAWFVEGIHEESRALTPAYDDVTLSLDLSPRAYYNDDPWNP